MYVFYLTNKKRKLKKHFFLQRFIETIEKEDGQGKIDSIFWHTFLSKDWILENTAGGKNKRLDLPNSKLFELNGWINVFFPKFAEFNTNNNNTHISWIDNPHCQPFELNTNYFQNYKNNNDSNNNNNNCNDNNYNPTFNLIGNLCIFYSFFCTKQNNKI